ncbi:P-loop containing nucleoside triphosphate hydrolase protein, partial [Cladorrhinum sp. PSN332]
PNSIRVHIYHGSNRAAGAHLLQDCDIVLTTYDTVRVDYARNEISESEEQAGVLHNVHWRRVVLDEAHVIRNRTSKVFKAICALKAIHRWCLTGTPIQNRLDDLGALAEFLRLDPFDSRSAFKNLSVNWRQIRLLFHAIALRRTKSLLTAQIQIPPRRNVVCPVFLDETEKQIYYLVQRHFALGMGSGGNIFQLVLRLRQVCNHGVELLPHRLREWVKKALTVGPQLLPVGDTVDDENCEFCAGEFTRGLQTLSCLHQICVTCMGQSTRSSDEGSLADCPVCDPASCSEPPRSPMNICESSSEIFQPIENQASSKIKALLKSLENDRTASLTSGKPQEKSVVFSAWTGMLDLTGRALLRNTFVFQRIDGNKSLAQRIQALQEFRHNSTCTVLLATLGSAGVGLDLTAASRVHIIEPGWNPMLERQAIDRVHRLGQQNEVVSTRYIVQSPDSKRESIEQFVERRQKLKTALVSASVGGSSMADEVGMNALIQDLSDVLHLDMAQV